MMLAKRTYVARSEIHGWGIFAVYTIRKGDVIDESPIALLPDRPDSVFSWCYDTDRGWALVLGDGVLANSADEPNADFEFDWDRSIVTLRATQEIRPDQEITLNYVSEGESQ